jgi:hypothetical protein
MHVSEPRISRGSQADAALLVGSTIRNAAPYVPHRTPRLGRSTRGNVIRNVSRAQLNRLWT